MKSQVRYSMLATFLAFWASCCCSEPYTYGYTGNAAVGGSTWDMGILPKEAGLAVNGVIYQYTAVKKPQDPMLVHVQNLNAKGNGYVFRETDDWSGRPGSTINKMVSVDNVPIGNWGKGSIEVEGTGEVVKQNVVYTYRIDHCFNPQSSPSCPGFKPVVPEIKIEAYQALEDLAVQIAMKKIEFKKEQEEKKNERKEQALKEAESALEEANSLSQSSVLKSMNLVTNMNSYYSLKMNGGVYKDVVSLKDSKMPENKLGLRNGLAQQLLHTQMVEMQFER